MNIAWATTATKAAPSLGMWEILTGASPMVMLVLILLVGFSVISWSIILFKWKTVRRSFSASDRFLDVFWSGKSMDAIYQESKRLSSAPVAIIFQSGYIELQRLIEKEKTKGPETKGLPADYSMGNLERALSRASRNEAMKLERSLTFLATAGSVSPFIGLFGTVLGIMNSFQNIGAQGGASLGTVAPGIAEALFATAVGLACAIPAVMGYNYYNHKIRAIRTQMENFAGDFLNISRRNFLTT